VHSFLWSGKDSEGKVRGVHVEAENAQAAKAILTARGWTELQLIRDEISDAVKKSRRTEFPNKVANLDPDEEIRRYLGKRPSFASKWWKAILREKGAYAWCALIVGVGVYEHQRGLLLRGSIEVLVTLLLFPLFFWFYSQSKRNYARLNRAKVHGRWNEVLECVERLRRSHRSTNIGVGEAELARNHALALAHLGRLEEAVAEYKNYENSPLVAHWLYLSHLSGIYNAGRQYDKAMECQLQMVAEKPDMAVGWIDLAGTLARKMNRPAQAREALARAEKLEITPRAKPFVSSIRGVIWWREGRPAEAKVELERALAEFQPFAHQPLAERSILRIKSYLCAVNGALGNQTEARKQFREVEKFLVAQKEDELLQACRATI
jgi:tetratricopeptide (TPR) repeat protein